MSGNIKVWRVIHNGQKYTMIPDHHETNHQAVATGLTEMEAANTCFKLNKAELHKSIRKSTGNFFTGMMHLSAETAGHCVKTIKDGYNKGRN